MGMYNKPMTDCSIEARYNRFKKLVSSKKVRELVIDADLNGMKVLFSDGQIAGYIGPLARRFIVENNLKAEVAE